MAVNDRKRIAEIVKAQGYYIDIDRWPRKVTYYKPTGEAMPNMPADPYSMELYLGKGFTLTPPKTVEPSNGGQEEVVEATAQDVRRELYVADPKPRKPRRKRKESKKGEV